MLFFTRKKKIETLLGGFTDAHSHLLPGVDDGVQTLADSLAILQLMEGAGVQTLWVTPHIMEDIPNTTARLQQRFAELREAYTGPVQLRLAAEYMLDSLFQQRLQAGDLLPWGPDGDHLLVETSCFTPPMHLRATLQHIQAAGYHPLLAHPERYLYLSTRQYQELKALRVRFQLNLPSLAGMYGSQVKQRAEALLQQGWYDAVGTDTHTLRFYQNLLQQKIKKLNF